ncbi:hypothetical protein [Lusitaniella coriacea]|uniref:hypothetical protein n=1 Tax=Lusitaniella coriacea TaxID=1983105 RepID=UPI003CF1989F
MQTDLNQLQIPIEELEDAVDLNPRLMLATDICRVFILKHRQQLLSVVLTELLTFVAIVAFAMPLGLIVNRSLGFFSNDPTDIRAFFAVLFGVSWTLLSSINFYLWQKAKKLKSLAKLMNEIEKYNQVIQSIDLGVRLDLARNPQQEISQDLQEMMRVLRTTRQSLIDALKVERIIREHQTILGNRNELCNTLATNLETLMTFELRNETSEYGSLVQNALQIGIAVYREVENLQNR